LARMHGVRLEGFGFFNTRELRRTGRIVGLDTSNQVYFHKRLTDHVQFLRDTGFLTATEVSEIESLLARHGGLLELPRGSVVHKDMAFWNIIGTECHIEAIIDWDDVIIGDPADDLAVMRCFFEDDVLDPLFRGYAEVHPIDELFRAKISLYLVRNMLWKAVIRTYMKYFEMDGGFFLLNREQNGSLRQFTYDRLFMGVEELRRI
jgi:fructosamine-3-kinase